MLRRSIVAVAKRPSLWPTALGALAAMSPQRWWARPPFLPIPEEDVVRWRVTTAYGDPDATLTEDDLVAYLEWRHRAAQGLRGPR